MAFCSFSKDCDGNSQITVENKFITKYLPEADGFAVKVYLYGLYLCGSSNAEFGLKSMAEVLKCTEADVEKAFEEVQMITHCSTGCGGCHDKVMDVLYELMA